MIFLLQAERRQVISLFRFSCFEILPALIFFLTFIIIRVVTCMGLRTPAVYSSLVFSQISGSSMLNNDNPPNINNSIWMLFSLRTVFRVLFWCGEKPLLPFHYIFTGSFHELEFLRIMCKNNSGSSECAACHLWHDVDGHHSTSFFKLSQSQLLQTVPSQSKFNFAYISYVLGLGVLH